MKTRAKARNCSRDDNDVGGAGAKDLIEVQWETGKMHAASRERALKASLGSLDLSVDRRELVNTLKWGRVL